VPDAIENFVDKLLPDDVEAKMDETAKAAVGAPGIWAAFATARGQAAARGTMHAARD
jgi:hypothetical protein